MRVRNTETGVTAEVSDAVAAVLGPQWEPADKPRPRKTKSE